MTRADPIATLDAIRHLERRLAVATDPQARGILQHAIGYLDADLRRQLSGARGVRQDTPTHGAA